jgi:hypothetical protein
MYSYIAIAATATAAISFLSLTVVSSLSTHSALPSRVSGATDDASVFDIAIGVSEYYAKQHWNGLPLGAVPLLHPLLTTLPSAVSFGG